MRITVFGAGYVGLVTAACFAEVGNDVVVVDVDAQRIAQLRKGSCPIYEPGLPELLERGRLSGKLAFTASAEEGVAHGEYLLIAVGTPPDEDGSADLRHVLAVARSIGEHLERGGTIVVIKSTVPVGTHREVRETIAGMLSKRGRALDFAVVSNPEFLKEGAAVQDFQRPDRIVIGCESSEALQRMRALYAPFNRSHERIVAMDPASAELTKYAANAMLATRISFMNEIAALAERVGADIEQVRIGIGSDPRIGFSFLYAGAGFGGSCFPKDLRALSHLARSHGLQSRILDAVIEVNERQKLRLFQMIERFFAGQLRGRTVAVWGLAFKPGTDDIREAPSRTLLEALWQAGARVRAYDPAAAKAIAAHYGPQPALTLCSSAEEAVEGADVLAIVTEWKIFWSPDYARLASVLRERAVFDGRNILDPEAAARAGLRYFGIGRGERLL